MMPLLEPDDRDSLRGQPGFTWRMANRLRAQRCQLFRSYLRALDQDFREVFMALRLIPLHSSHDRPDLAAALIRRGVRLGSAHGGSATAAVPGPLERCRVDAAGVIQMFDSMRLQLPGLVPATADLTA
jgi:hypothetical protein